MMLASSKHRIGFGILALAAVIFLMRPVSAHHGWGWASEEESEVTGTVTAVRLGNPHGEVKLDVKGYSGSSSAVINRSFSLAERWPCTVMSLPGRNRSSVSPARSLRQGCPTSREPHGL